MPSRGTVYFCIVSHFTSKLCFPIAHESRQVAGHGSQLVDDDGDEEDGKDEGLFDLTYSNIFGSITYTQ